MSDPPPTPTFKQTRRRLEILTRLSPSDPDIDPLLLIWVKGSEEISQPYTYHVKMWRLVNRDNPPIPPGDMIDTRVSIHLNITATVKEDALDTKGTVTRTHVRRCGVFETFNDEGLVLGPPTKLPGKEFRIRQYSGTIVPPFKMMAYETAYRVFENKNVEEIIDEVTDGFPNFRLDKSKLTNRFFPKMQYCVQYNESTFNFLSRLMAQFGIWYYFDHKRDNANDDDVTMMLGAGEVQFDRCQVHSNLPPEDHPIHRLIELNNKDLSPSALIIKDFQRIYAPMTRRARFGNFNILNPIDPITNALNIQPLRDLIVPPRTVFGTKGRGRAEPTDDDRFRTEHFAAPVDLNNESPEAPNAQTYATDWMRWREALVARVSGSTRNVAFMPGFTFERLSSPFKGIGEGEDPIGEEEKAASGAGADIVVFKNSNFPPPQVSPLGSYVLLRVEFEGLVIAYSEKKDLPKILSELLFPKNLTTDDVLANSTVQALNDYMQKAAPQHIEDGTLPELDIETLLPGGSTFGMIAKMIPLIAKIVEELKDKSTNDFHCSFAAMPLRQIEYQGDGFPTANAQPFSLPLPSGWVKPIVNGPHLAVVIGQDGVKTDPNEIFADSLGRVRVRFPWDRKKGEKPGDSFKRGDHACWVRVSEGWAGRQFGTQFLPRIGHEVIVDFLDGDPDRPIITGRVYNADRGFANLPFTKSEVDLELVERQDLFQPLGSPEFRFEGIKTSSTPSPPGNGKPRYHLTRFDDKLNCEQYLIRSQGRLDVTAFAHSFETTHGNKHVRVVPGKDKDGKTFGGSEFTTVGGEYDLHIGDSRYEGVEKAYNLTVKTDTVFDLQTAHHTMVGTESTLNAKNIVIEAPIKITLKVGNSFVVLDPAGVWIQGAVVMINSGGVPGITADVEVIDPADAEAAEPGDQWMKRVTTCDPHPRGGGGRRRGRTVKAKHGLAVTANADGSLQVGAGIRVAGGTPAYRDAVITDLATMDQTPGGHAVIDSLNTSGRTTTITPLTPPATPSNAFATPANAAAASVPGTPGTLDGAGNPIAGAGTGSDSTLNYNPSDWPDPTYRTKPPGDVILFHELKHADHNAHGTRDVTPRADNFDDQEEFNTIQDENQYRDQRGHPRRNDHHDL